MNTGEKPFWLNYLEWNVFLDRTGQDAVVYEIKITIRPQSILGMAKAKKGDNYTVAFCGAKNLSSLSGEIKELVRKRDDKWARDKYPPT